MKFTGYERRLTTNGDREVLHAIFEIGRMKNPFGDGEGPLSICYTKRGLEDRLAAKKEGDDRLLLIDIFHNWPDDETVNKE